MIYGVSYLSVKLYVICNLNSDFSIKHIASNTIQYSYLFPSVRSQAPLLTESPLAGYHGRYVNVWHCGWLSIVLLQLKVLAWNYS